MREIRAFRYFWPIRSGSPTRSRQSELRSQAFLAQVDFGGEHHRNAAGCVYGSKPARPVVQRSGQHYSDHAPHSRSAIYTRTAAMTRCASCAKAGGVTRWRSTHRPRRDCAPILKRPSTAPTSTGRCSGRSSTTASAGRNAGVWTRTPSTAWLPRQGRPPDHARSSVARHQRLRRG